MTENDDPSAGEVRAMRVMTTKSYAPAAVQTFTVMALPRSVVLSEPELHVSYSATIRREWSVSPLWRAELCSVHAVREIVLSLLEVRDFLGHQLSHATGLIDDDELDALTEEHFEHIGMEADKAILPRALLLRHLLNDRLDSDIAAAALRCDFEQAERVLTRIGAMSGALSELAGSGLGALVSVLTKSLGVPPALQCGVVDVVDDETDETGDDDTDESTDDDSTDDDSTDDDSTDDE